MDKLNGGIPVEQMVVFTGKNTKNKYYKIHFEDDGFASMYETDDENSWDYEEAMRIVRMENEKLEKNDEQ